MAAVQKFQPSHVRPPAKQLASKQVEGDDAYILSFTGGVAGHKTAKTLAGEYVAEGVMHGRKVYKKRKLATDDPEQVEIYCYFWEDDSSAGWWLGSRLGGSEVWAKADGKSVAPPRDGWRIPWNGDIRKDMSILSKKVIIQQQRARKEEQKKQEELARKEEKQLAVQRRADDHRKQQIAAEVAEAQSFVREAETSVHAAEDLIDKATIVSQMVTGGDEDDGTYLDKCLVDTEGAVKEAEFGYKEAESQLQQCAEKLSKMGDEARDSGQAELLKLQAALQEKVKTLAPLKGLRKEVEHRRAARRMVDELQSKVTDAELAIEDANKTIYSLSDEAPSSPELTTAEDSLAKALVAVETVKKDLDKQSGNPRPVVKERVPQMRERIVAAEQRLTELKNLLAEGGKRREVQDILQEAEAKLQGVYDKVDKIADMESVAKEKAEKDKNRAKPDFVLKEELALVEKMTLARTDAQTALIGVQKFISQKCLAVKRNPDNFTHKALQKLEEFKNQLGEASKKLDGIKLASLERKQRALISQAKDAVEQAVTLGAKVADAAQIIADDSKLLDLTEEEVTKARESTARAEGYANDALVQAQRLVTNARIEARGKDTQEDIKKELAAMSKSVLDASTIVMVNKKLADTVSGRIGAQHMLKTALKKIERIDELVQHAVQAGDKIKQYAEKAASTEEVTDDPEATVEKEVDGTENKTEEKKPEPDKADAQNAADAEAGTENVTEAGEPQNTEEKKPEPDKVDVQKAPEAKPSSSELVDTFSAFESSLARSTVAFEETKSFLDEGFSRAAEMPLETRMAIERQLREAMKRLEAAQTRHKKLEAVKGEQKEVYAELVPERRRAEVQNELESYLQTARTKLSECEEGAESLANIASNPKLSTDDMKVAVAKADTAHRAAAAAYTSCKKVLLKEIKAMEGDREHATKSIYLELEHCKTELEPIKAALAKLEASLKESEHRFVATRLAHEATELVEDAEKKYSIAAETADPLISDDREELASSIMLTYLLENLQAQLPKIAKTAKELFRDMAGGSADAENPTVAPTQFVSYLHKMSEDSNDSPKYSEEDLRQLFEIMDSRQAELLTEADFLDHFKHRYECISPASITSDLPVKTSKTKRKLAVNEVFVGIREPEKDSSLDLLRVFGKAEKDGLEGWVTVAGNKGTIFLSTYKRYESCVKRVETKMRQAQEVSSQVSVHLKNKLSDLRAVSSGPLEDAKSEITRLQARLRNLDDGYKDLREKVAAGKLKHQKCIDKEKARQQQLADRKSALSMTTESTKLVAEAEESVVPAAKAAEALLRPGALSALDDPTKAVDEASTLMKKTLDGITSAIADLQKRADVARGVTSGPLADARSEMAKLKVQLGSIEVKCKRLQTSLQDAHARLQQHAQQTIRKALLRYMRESAVTPSTLYYNSLRAEESSDELVPVARLREFLKGLPDCAKLSAHQLDSGLQRFPEGLSRFGLLGALCEYRQCVRETALLTTAGGDTDKDAEDDPDSVTGKVVRQVQRGELLEITDNADDLGNLPCRTLMDSKEGFVTVRNVDDEEVSQVVSKPYYCFSAPLPLQKGLQSNTDTIRNLQVGEVLEVLEGPRKEPTLEIIRARCKAMKDGAKGFLTTIDKLGEALLKPRKLLVCVTSIAITTEFDVAEGKSIRKLVEGEVLQAVEGIREDTERDLKRIHARALDDEVEGWVTMTGFQGATYVEESSRHHECIRSVALEEQLATGSEEVRTLEQGELVEVVEGPLTYKKKGVLRLKGRSLIDDQEGWLSITKLSSQRWSPDLRCAKATTIDSAAAILTCKKLRHLEVGELLEALDAPILEEKAKVMRVRARAKKDGLIGHVTVKGNKGTVFLEVIE